MLIKASFVAEWESTGEVPKDLLQDLKVYMYHNYISVYSLCRHGLIVALIILILNYCRAAGVPPLARSSVQR